MGLEALDVLVEEKLADRSAELGSYLLDKLATLKSPFIKGLRGKGLFIGVEIDPRKARAREVCERLMVQGILSKETHETVLRLAPPLVVTKEQLDWAVERIGLVLEEMGRMKAAS